MNTPTAAKAIAISEIYGPVLQGEGPTAGQACLFLRVFGCDSLCQQCDSLYAVVPGRKGSVFSMLPPEYIVQTLNALDGPGKDLPIVFSGGNPAIWDMTDVIEGLRKDAPHRRIWVETQGTYWRDWIRSCNVVVVSPKGPFMNDQKLGLTTIEQLKLFYLGCTWSSSQLNFKVVVGGPEDFDYAESIAREFPGVPMYLSVGCVHDPVTSPTGVLLTKYRTLGELLLEDEGTYRWPHLRSRARFLPQLHVLAHGSGKRGV